MFGQVLRFFTGLFNIIEQLMDKWDDWQLEKSIRNEIELEKNQEEKKVKQYADKIAKEVRAMSDDDIDRELQQFKRK